MSGVILCGFVFGQSVTSLWPDPTKHSLHGSFLNQIYLKYQREIQLEFAGTLQIAEHARAIQRRRVTFAIDNSLVIYYQHSKV